MLRAYAVPSVRAAEDSVRAGLGEGELMLRAARGLAEVVAIRAAQLDVARIVVLAGPGDNGGDALHAGALLAGPEDVDEGLGGHAVAVVGVAQALHAGGVAAARAAGVAVHEVRPDLETLPEEVCALVAEADLVVDGLLGIGGRPGLGEAMSRVVDQVPDTAYLLSVDLPSGADPEGREPVRESVFADETVTFSLLKPVHLLPATEAAVGRLTVLDIGVDPEGRPTVERLEHADVADLWPVPGARDHKYTRGVVGVVAGSEDYPGAAVLTVTAALEAGAGMVRYLGPRRCEDLVLAACPETVPGRGQVQAWVVGPGAPAADLVRQALESGEPCVVDAGALDVLAELAQAGGLTDPGRLLLTPHAGELARLLTRLEGADVAREAVEADPVGASRRAAGRTGAVVLLKGSATVVAPADPDAPVRVQADAPAWLATAGVGDVLAGVAGVLLAAGLDPVDAGSLAALVHGVAADRATPGGPVRALAVARALPSAVAHLLAV